MLKAPKALVRRIVLVLGFSVVGTQALADEPPPAAIVRKNTIEVFPIVLCLGRASIGYERELYARHALALGVFAQASGFLVPTSEQAMAALGGEIGYRYYSRESMSGYFIGPSVGLGRYYYADSLRPGDLIQGDLSTKGAGFFTSFDLAFDAGYKHLFKNGGVLGFGLGAQYNLATKTEKEMSPIAFYFAGTGFRPRLLLIIGAAF